MNIYISNLSYDVNDSDLAELFGEYGKVSSAKVIMDKYSGRSRGFGFVEMPSVAEGQAAMNGLNGKILRERTLNVNAARPRTDSRRDGFGGGRQRR